MEYIICKHIVVKEGFPGRVEKFVAVCPDNYEIKDTIFDYVNLLNEVSRKRGASIFLTVDNGVVSYGKETWFHFEYEFTTKFVFDLLYDKFRAYDFINMIPVAIPFP